MKPAGYVSEKHAALVLGVSLNVLEILIDFGSIKSKTVGLVTWVNADDIAQYRDKL